MEYGKAPGQHGIWDLKFEEYMHYMYLPIFIPESSRIRIPENLSFARDMILAAIEEEWDNRYNPTTHVYVTARRGYATPGNPLNRPGWHSDGFGTDDVNYVWTDRFPTLFAIGDFGEISKDHVVSSDQFTNVANNSTRVQHRTYRDKELLRLDPSVIHTAPPIPAPGGERSFFKISFSNERYNLKGNAHNHLLDYEWPMYDRQTVRNDPHRAQDDTVKEEK